jgi:NAD-dependent deacetylase
MLEISFSDFKNIVILTGAGVSVASGIRTYRGTGGVWKEFDVEKYGHIDRLADDPQKIWQLFGSLRSQLLHAKPNRVHIALAQFEQKLGTDQQFTLITQNVDGLHTAAGSKNVIELHGNISRTKCSNPSCDFLPYSDTQSHSAQCPTCPQCAHPLRPDIVLFGEQLPALQDWSAKRALRDCDLFLAVGTSGVVFPAASFARSAQYAGARTIYQNIEPMQPYNPAFRESCIGKAEEVLPELLGVSGVA